MEIGAYRKSESESESDDAVCCFGLFWFVFLFLFLARFKPAALNSIYSNLGR